MRTKLAVFALGAALIAPRLAAAQTAAPDAQIFAGGLVGVTFGTETGAMFGGRVGFRVSRNLHLFADVGRITDVTPKEISDQIDAALEFLPDDISVSLTAKTPTTYVAGGVRWSQTLGRVGPFAEAGVGVGHITADIKLIIDGIDISDELRDEIGDDASTTEFLFMFGGGVNFTISPVVSVDAGYRFTRIATDNPAVNCSAVYGMVVFRIK
ncbi:MAG TPA: outer membrane beta-barrel protein [Vicinamibacterales bacterium]|nr:outer membrane beta-barrel protein [Vicinamibacterales bacterium]